MDATSYLCVLRDGTQQYLEHREVLIPFPEDWEIQAWFSVGGQREVADDAIDPDQE
jgi:hypothetical protein